MSFRDILGQTAAVAVAVERATEILKPLYLSAKNRLLKKEQTECSKVEKILMTTLLSILACIFVGIGFDIPGINESSTVQEILAGLVSSFGSSILHTLVALMTGFKDNIEAHNARMRK